MLDYFYLLAQFFIVLLERTLCSRRTSVKIPLMLATHTVYRRIKIEMARVVKPFIIESSYRLVQITVKIRQRFCCFSMERDSSIPQLHTRHRRTSLNLCRFQVRSMSLVEFFARSILIPRSILITAYNIYPFKDLV